MSPLIYYILASLGGAVLTWLLIGGNKAKLLRLEQENRREKAALNDMLVQLNKFKNDAKYQIKQKETEISKLKKATALPDIITNAQEKEIKHWKSKAKALEGQLAANPKKGSGEDSKKLKSLAEELDNALLLINEKDQELDDLRTAITTVSEQEDIEELLINKISKLKKKVKSYRKKLKKTKALKAKVETIEVRESLNIKKILKLLKTGQLTKTTTKKVSGKKPRKSPKQKKKSKKTQTAGAATSDF